MSGISRSTYTPATEDANGDIELSGMEGNATTALTKDCHDKGKMNKVPEKGHELRVYYTGDTHFRRRTKLETYLIAVSILLFVACVAFIVIAFTRESRSSGKLCVYSSLYLMPLAASL